jgi:hypothetical protein
MKRLARFAVLLVLATGATGCRTQHDIHTVSEVKPIHITIDVNVKVDRELDDFFSDIDDAGETDAPQPKGEQK